MKLGLAHSTMFEGDGSIADPVAVARHVEDLGLDSLWVSDHLAWGTPILDSVVALAAASAATERIEVGFAVLQLALRRVSWIAKQIGSLQLVSGGRLQLGVGVGGHPAQEWEAAGSTLADRGRRTDEALDVLPSLLSGEETRLPDVDASVALRPAAPMPPLWIGGDSRPALKRVARTGAGWLPAAVTPGQVAVGRQVVEDLTGTRPATTVSVFATLNAHRGGMSRDALVDLCANGFGFPREHADAVVVGGKPEEVADALRRFADLGVGQVVVVPFGSGWAEQCELLAEAGAVLAS
ncbi:LLM class flavin-dependent oxidoreductase [Saccharothrix sp. S26]|uniref:LLM class flavin-dependent oxidoreductase n=1 Tax=Saccharothrix sp. S26 TaxID=2907215 RepID=UPI001F276632|nr:LLM class flavin-dependent oxidoreductase [Saccharothrix sp. S26]MCE7000779.1 LLM class flavin-dependent oxidoreductase [Saccharothrix sp. S26]